MIKSSVFSVISSDGHRPKNKVDVLGYGTNALFMLMCLLMNRGASSCLFFRAWGHMVARFAKNVSCYNHHQGQRGGPTYSLLFSAAAAATAACRHAPLPPRAAAAACRGCCRHSHELPPTVAVATNVSPHAANALPPPPTVAAARRLSTNVSTR